MKYSTFVLILFFTINTQSYGQIKSANAITYSQPFQVDSTDYFVIGSLVDKTNKQKYNLGVGYNYGLIGGWTNAFFYNIKTDNSNKLFEETPILISPIVGSTFGTFGANVRQGNTYSALLDNSILFLVKTDTYNKDGIIDEDDPYSIYIATKSGQNLKQITPSNMNVISWQVTKDFKTIILKLQQDKNGDKKFSDEDEILYRVDLTEKFSNIKLSPIKL